MRRMIGKTALVLGLSAGLSLATGGAALAATKSFNFTAVDGTISAPDGGQLYMWGYANNGAFQYPGATIDVDLGDVVEVTLTNDLPDVDGLGPQVPDEVSIVFAGQEGVEISRDGGGTWSSTGPDYKVPGDKRTLSSLSDDVHKGDTVIYRFTANKLGTYHYFSGTSPQKHVDMGLLGALIVRPGGGLKQAYASPDTAYDVEYLQLLSAIDPGQHENVQAGLPYNTTTYQPEYWFINGRSFPDTVSDPNVDYLPAQPMSAVVAMYPGERALLRIVTADRDLHPHHHHGNHADVVAINGSLMASQPDSPITVADLARERFTQTVSPGESVDAIFTWDPMNEPFGWDVEGNDPNAPVPVDVLPIQDDPTVALNYGETYSGSPYIGQKGALPGDVQAISINQQGEQYMVFHSHHELELQNQGAGPGGMLTLIMICPAGLPCPNH